MTYAMIEKITKLMPPMRHKRSQNARVIGPLVNEVMVKVERALAPNLSRQRSAARYGISA
jgi:hypothetical protein